MENFDPFKQAKLNNAYNNMQNYSLSESDKETTIDELLTLSGSSKITGETTPNIDTTLTAKKVKYQADNNIKPGDPAWFKLHFAKTYLTGEDPFS